jgi:hypothetical protein
MAIRTFVFVGALLFAMIPAPSYAQSDFIKDHMSEVLQKVGVHLNMSFREPIDPDVTKGTTFGGSIGLSPGRTNGWTYPVGFTMFGEDLHSPSGATFGEMRTKAIMAGIGYGWHFGRLSTGATLQTGFAMNRGRTMGDIQQAFDVPNGAVSMHVSNSALLRPQVKAEYFLTPKLTMRVSADYMLMRPDIIVTTPEGQFANRWNASNFHANFGFGLYPFRHSTPTVSP